LEAIVSIKQELQRERMEPRRGTFLQEVTARVREVREARAATGKDPRAVALGRLGGLAKAKRMAERQAGRKAEQKELHTPSPAKPKRGTFLQEATATEKIA
jgi:hypothetical protein